MFLSANVSQEVCYDLARILSWVCYFCDQLGGFVIVVHGDGDCVVVVVFRGRLRWNGK